MRVFRVLFLAAAVYAQPVPLPNLPDGFRIGTGGVVVETFMDLLCPDCVSLARLLDPPAVVAQSTP